MSRKPDRLDRRRKAFSLVELMAVLVILGMLSGLVAYKTRSYLIYSKQNAAKVEIAKVREAIEAFYAVCDCYPTNEEGIEILTKPSAKFAEGLLSKVPRDPWGNPYQYNNPGKIATFDVICYGADGREGGDGPNQDITSTDQQSSK